MVFLGSFVHDDFEYIVRNDGTFKIIDSKMVLVDSPDTLLLNEIKKVTDYYFYNIEFSKILKKMYDVDSKKIRAISDSILNNDNTKLQDLELESQTLRDELRSLSGT